MRHPWSCTRVHCLVAAVLAVNDGRRAAWAQQISKSRRGSKEVPSLQQLSQLGAQPFQAIPPLTTPSAPTDSSPRLRSSKTVTIPAVFGSGPFAIPWPLGGSDIADLHIGKSAVSTTTATHAAPISKTTTETPSPTPHVSKTPTPPPRPLEDNPAERRRKLYEADAQRGSFYDWTVEDVMIESSDGEAKPGDVSAEAAKEAGSVELTSDDGGNARSRAVASVNALGAARVVGTSITNHQLGVRPGAGPAAFTALGANRMAFVAHRRISAINTDFNLPVSPRDRFGAALAVIGGLNGDVSSVEVAIGAPGDNSHSWDTGAVYITSLDWATSNVRGYHKIIPGEGALTYEQQAKAGFGSSLAVLDSYDANGCRALAVGAPFRGETGAVYVLFLRQYGAVSHFIKITKGTANFQAPLKLGDEFGCSLAKIGDLNNDGVQDLAVGACGDDDVRPGYRHLTRAGAAGAVYLLFMNSDGTVKYHNKISALYGNLATGPRDGDRFGASIAFLGDIGRRGFSTIAVGAPFADVSHLSGIAVGEVYLLELLNTGDVKRYGILGTTYVPPEGLSYNRLYLSAPLRAFDYLGSAMATADVDGDGVTELLMGARGLDRAVRNEGAVILGYLGYDGTLKEWDDMTSLSGLRVPDVPLENFGSAIAVASHPSLPSVILVGAPGEPSRGLVGCVYVVHAQKIG